jgi:hypothetical protein
MSMDDKLVSALSRTIFDTQLVSARMSLCLAEFLWFVFLIFPGNTFDRPIYALMKTVLTEDLWSLIFLVSAACHFYIIISENFYGIFARMFSLLNSLLWVSVVVLVLVASNGFAPASLAGDAALAIIAIWIWLQPKILFRGICHARSGP